MDASASIRFSVRLGMTELAPLHLKQKIDMKHTALITGAAGGLGQAVAEQLAREGWELVVVGRDADRLQQAFGPAHRQIVADCSTSEGVRTVFATLKAEQIQPTALAHCIGNIRLGALHRMSEADFDLCLRANLISAFHTLAGFVNSLRDARSRGAAVLVSSAAARVGTRTTRRSPPPRPASGAWCAARLDLRPGRHPLQRGRARHDGNPGHRRTDQQRHRARGRRPPVPLPGIGTPAELADLMCWLLSERAARVTGQVWSLDGGFSAIRPLVK